MTEPLPTNAMCVDCGQTIAIDNGVLRQHIGTGPWTGLTCPGSGAMIYPPIPNPVEEIPSE